VYVKVECLLCVTLTDTVIESVSSVSSYLSGSAAMCWDDILRLKLYNLPENKKAILNRILGRYKLLLLLILGTCHPGL